MAATKKLLSDYMSKIMIDESMRVELHWMEQEYLHYQTEKKINDIYFRRKKMG